MILKGMRFCGSAPLFALSAPGGGEGGRRGRCGASAWIRGDGDQDRSGGDGRLVA